MTNFTNKEVSLSISEISKICLVDEPLYFTCTIKNQSLVRGFFNSIMEIQRI
jgi:hypothetical protein